MVALLAAVAVLTIALATWQSWPAQAQDTYIVNDDPFEANPMMSLAHNPARAAGAAVLWPLLLAWGIWERWRRRPPGMRDS